MQGMYIVTKRKKTDVSTQHIVNCVVFGLCLVLCTYINILFGRSDRRFSFRLCLFIYLMLRTHSYFWLC